MQGETFAARSGERLEESLLSYAASDHYPFHMPGHKRRISPDGNPFLAGDFPLAACDITEIEGFDDLHDPRGILRSEMERAARFFGTEATFFSVNGSTCSNLTAISAAVPKGGRILIGPKPHRSILHAAFLRDLTADELPCEALCDGIPGPVRPELVEEAFRKARYDAVVITSPTYEGIVSDIGRIAEIAHRFGAVLIVDEAHGAHLSLHPYFPASARTKGADLVTQSLHKTLPSLTQTSLLHSVTGRIPAEEIQKWFDIYETSSPSYLLMASITSCVHFLTERGEEAFGRYAEALEELRKELRGLARLRLLEHPCAEPSKLVILTGDSGSGGEELTDRLRREHHLETERCGEKHVLAMTSVCDTKEGFARLRDALFAIDGSV